MIIRRYRLFKELKEANYKIPQKLYNIPESVIETLKNIADMFEDYFKDLPKELITNIDNYINSIEKCKDIKQSEVLNNLELCEEQFRKLNKYLWEIFYSIAENIDLNKKIKENIENKPAFLTSFFEEDFNKKYYSDTFGKATHLLVDIRDVLKFVVDNMDTPPENAIKAIKTFENEIENIDANSFFIQTKSSKGIAADLISDLINSIFDKNNSEEKAEKRKEALKDVNVSDYTDANPELIRNFAEKYNNKLNDVDKTVLKYYHNNASYVGYVATNGCIAKGITSEMTPEGIVMLAVLSVDKFFPETDERDIDEGDIQLVLQDIKYNGGSSEAIIHYGQPKNNKKDSAFFELIVNPSTKIGDEVGRVQPKTRSASEDDPTRFLTKVGKRQSLYDWIKFVNGEDNSSRRTKKW